MHDRRRFLKRLLAGGAALGLCPATDPRAGARPAGEADGEPPAGYAWQRTIFCQFGDPFLASSIDHLAKKLSCDICWGMPFSLDVIAVPSFVVILDRGTLDREQWALYLEYREEVGDETPCVLVDDKDPSKYLRMIDHRLESRDPGNHAHLSGILRLVRDTHRAAQDWKPGQARGQRRGSPRIL